MNTITCATSWTSPFSTKSTNLHSFLSLNTQVLLINSNIKCFTLKSTCTIHWLQCFPLDPHSWQPLSQHKRPSPPLPAPERSAPRRISASGPLSVDTWRSHSHTAEGDLADKSIWIRESSLKYSYILTDLRQLLSIYIVYVILTCIKVWMQSERNKKKN